MIYLKHNFAALILILLFGLCLPPPATSQMGAAAKRFDAHPVSWKRLLYKAKNIFGNVTTEVQLEFLPAGMIGDLLIKTPQGAPFQPLGQHIGSIMVRSNINPLIGANSEIVSDSLFNLNDARALRRIRQLKGKEYWQKTYRFTQSGVYRLRKRPNDPDETLQDLAQWTDTRESFYPYDLTGHGCLQVMEPSTLLYIISSAGLFGEGEILNLCVFNKKQLHNLQVRELGLQRLKMSYKEVFALNKVINKEGKFKTFKISMRSRPLVAENETAEAFSFLGLKGEIEFFLDPVSRIPVQICGRIPYVGRLEFKLNKVWMRTDGNGS
ncbi:MAG: hypothetical protein PVF53_05300 [Desulfobacterales bacterium]|jgi:hypothetical protein